MLRHSIVNLVFRHLGLAGIIVSLIIVGVACFCDNTQAKTIDPEQEDMLRFQSFINKYTACAWVDKYNSCFCGSSQGFNWSVLTWAPNKVCGK